MDLYIGYTEQLRMSNDKPKTHVGDGTSTTFPFVPPEAEQALWLTQKMAMNRASTPAQPLPDQTYTGSFAELVRLLPVGKSTAKVELLDWDNLPPAGDTERLIQMRERLRNSLASTVNRARAYHGGLYSIEVGETCMPGGSIYITAVITRTR